jgi:hypothetical protein
VKSLPSRATLLQCKNVRIKTKDYEKGNMEDGDTGHCIDSDSGTDCDGNDIMYGAWTILRSEE